ncbi:hypothetical protein ILUMI_11051 [Ignelater luminosus]|uniref:Uncharacterized protein n=1 Tax=Ignelater luminosus TaxID=2038154 RepID=A0A8K0D0Y2_IGNLU|nr:hypothetical protein ILUMI_11051 [Ignelater luminosus]
MEAFRPFFTFTKTVSNVSKIDFVENSPEELTLETNLESGDNLENQSNQFEITHIEGATDTEPQETVIFLADGIQLAHSTPLPLSDTLTTKTSTKQKTCLPL